MRKIGMRRIGRASKVSLMTGKATQILESIIAGSMAALTRNSQMRAGQGKMRGCVAKGGWCPCSRAVACPAIMREGRCYVVRVGWSLEIRRMALVTFGERKPKIVIRVARVARRAHVRSR